MPTHDKTKKTKHPLYSAAIKTIRPVVDTASYEVRRYMLVGQRVWQLAFNGDGSRLFAVNGLSNDVSVIDVAKLNVIKSVPVGRLPWGIAVKP